jgi:hypothetical protein
VPAIDPGEGAMKRRWNLTIWIGFLMVLAAPFIYLSVFLRFPILRDAPWTTLLISAPGIGLMARGVRRAWRRPETYRGRIAGSILLTLGVACVALFAFEIFYRARRLPASQGAPRVGGKAPGFTLQDQDGHAVTLAALLAPDAGGAGRVNGAVLIFYRGYW